MIKIQLEDFNIEDEINKVISKNPKIGGVSTFIGYVRNINEKKAVKSIYLEVYKEMALKKLEEISLNASKKWDLLDTLIIHRYGKLIVNEKIVLVATFSIHRKNSFESCNYIMDYLKKDAPFWKKEIYDDGNNWLENKISGY
ncbi:MAG: molybdopterin biosynthesis protein MoeE [Rickettsiales bacterium]|nr:molybdopterin biosynthesis protein MoeE [Rickettsiales bacterium]|tara:strand:- start:14528 stop:14953 length:426 start_codon:yes stop_codon:yes gene_type:complete